jgi:hypothetical protein
MIATELTSAAGRIVVAPFTVTDRSEPFAVTEIVWLVASEASTIQGAGGERALPGFEAGSGGGNATPAPPSAPSAIDVVPLVLDRLMVVEPAAAGAAASGAVATDGSPWSVALAGLEGGATVLGTGGETSSGDVTFVAVESVVLAEVEVAAGSGAVGVGGAGSATVGAGTASGEGGDSVGAAGGGEDSMVVASGAEIGSASCVLENRRTGGADVARVRSTVRSSGVASAADAPVAGASVSVSVVAASSGVDVDVTAAATPVGMSGFADMSAGRAPTVSSKTGGCAASFFAFCAAGSLE